MQLVRSHEVFSLLCDVALLVGRNQFGRDGRVHDVEECLLRAFVLCSLCNPAYEMPDQSLWNRSIYAIHRHVVAVVCCPSECQFAEVACAHNEAIHLIGSVHEDLSAFASLSVLVGRVVLLYVVTNVVEVLDASLLDAYLANSDAEQLHEVHGIGIGTVCCAEARHCDAHDAASVFVQSVECSDANQQGKRRVKTATDAHHNGLGIRVHDAFSQSFCLDVEYLLAAFVEACSTWYKGMGIDDSGQRERTSRNALCIDDVGLTFAGCSCGESRVPSAFGTNPLHINLRFEHLCFELMAFRFSQE